MPSQEAGDLCESSPYVLKGERRVVYDYSRFAEPLGGVFVAAACQEVVRQRTVAGVSDRTWVDNYVKRLEQLLESLSGYRDAIGIAAPLEYMTEQQWREFSAWEAKRIEGLPLAQRTRSKIGLTLNKLLVILAAAKAIPVQIELPRQLPRKIAKVGESPFTKKGWGQKEKTPRTPSPFEVIISAHGRSYDYEPYRPLGRVFMLHVVKAVSSLYINSRKSRAKRFHEVLINFLQHLISLRQQCLHEGLFSSLDAGTFASIPSLDWERVLYEWRDAQRLKKPGMKNLPSLITSHMAVKNLAIVWQHMASSFVVPHVELVGYKNARKKSAGKPRSSLAELSARSPLDEENYSAAVSRLDKFIDPVERDEARMFLRSLCRELSPEVVQGLSADALTTEILGLNSRRLRAFRACAEDDFLKWSAHWQRGQAALAAASLPAKDLVYLLDSTARSVSERRRSSTELLFSGDEEARLGNALLYILETQGGVATGIHGRYHHLMRSFDGRFAFHAYLHPHPDAAIALWVMLLVDTGANLEVVREMPADCLKATNDRETMKLVLGPKNRSGGKVIVDELPVAPEAGQKISAVEAIRRYQAMSARYRAMAGSDAQKLFLHEYKGEVNALTEWTARGWFVSMLNRHESLRGLDARPSFIRPSVLLDVQHRSVEGMVAAQAVADHISGATTLGHYTGRTPTKLLYAKKIREFQDRFQIVIIASIEGAAQKLGLSESQFQHLFSEAARTGLGVACLNPKAGVQPGTKQGQGCTRLDACHGCEMRWVVGTLNNITDLILFNEHLATSQSEVARLQPDVWEQRWLPWLVFSDIALTKLSQGETAVVFAQAKKEVQSRRLAYQPFPLY